MDDLKRAIYMRARELIEEELKIDPEYNYGICIALLNAAEELLGEGVITLTEEVPEWFPEFTSLDDGRTWVYKSYTAKFYPTTPRNLRYWWYIGVRNRSIYGKKNPRLSTLDYILSKQG